MTPIEAAGEVNAALTPTQQAILDYQAGGGSEEALLNIHRTAVSIDDEGIKVSFARNGDAPERFDASFLMPLANLRRPLAEIVAARLGEIAQNSLAEELKRLSRFVVFLKSRGMLDVQLDDFDNSLLASYVAWLDELRTSKAKAARPGRSNAFAATRRKGGKPLTADYKRQLYDVLVFYLRRLRLTRDHGAMISDSLDLYTIPAWRSFGRKKPTAVLTRPELKALVRICRSEVVSITERLRSAWAILEGRATESDLARVDFETAGEAFRMEAFFDGLPPPCRDELRVSKLSDEQRPRVADREFSKRSFPKLFAMNGPAFQNALRLLYPSPREMVPFVLLFAVYYRYNPSVLGKLRKKDFKKQAGINGERYQGQPYKNRSGRLQHASWPITTDLHNPLEMVGTIERWTAGIRRHATGKAKAHLFLSRTHARSVRSFETVNSFKLALGQFLNTHGKSFDKPFTIKSIRPSVIDLVHHLFDGDPIAAMHAGHHRQVSTTTEHYLQDGARKRNDEGLAPVLGAMGRYVETNGVIDPRAHSDFTLAATPGWRCRNPYAGAQDGEPPEHLCRAYGRCVDCEEGVLDLDSPLACAFATKLAEALERGRTAMTEHAWLERWMPIKDVLDRTLLAFTDNAVANADLSIPDLPVPE